MTPKEKAEELVRKYYTFGLNNIPFQSYCWFECKKLALIAVDEISWILNEISYNADIDSEMYFYNEVKQEIEKL